MKCFTFIQEDVNEFPLRLCVNKMSLNHHYHSLRFTKVSQNNSTETTHETCNKCSAGENVDCGLANKRKIGLACVCDVVQAKTKTISE